MLAAGPCRRWCARLCLLLVLPGGAAMADELCRDPQATLLWEIEGLPEGQSLHLFGSVHLGKPSFYPLPAPVEAAYHQADHWVVEVDLDAAGDMRLLLELQQRGMLPPGETLADHVSDETLAALERVLETQGLHRSMVMGMKPWFINVMLASMQMGEFGYLPQYGVEQYLLSQRPEQTRLLELEGFEAQLGFLESLNDESSLRYTLAGLEEGGEEAVEGLMQAWRCADVEALVEEVFSGLDDDLFTPEERAALKDTLFLSRNQQMASALLSFLEDGQGRYFVVVGAAHLVGEGSVIDHLRESGLAVTRLRLQESETQP